MLRTGPRRALLYKRPAAVVSSWTPLLASTAAYWWMDADNSGSITSSGLGTECTQWNDLGTGAHNMTPPTTGPTYTANVQNGKPGMDFSGGAGVRTGFFSIAQPFMLVIVWKQTGSAPGAYGILWDGNRAAVGNRPIVFNQHFDNSNHYGIYAGTFVSQGSTTSTSTAYHSRAIFDDNDSSTTRNGSAVTGDAGPDFVDGDGISMGGVGGASTYPNAYICEAFLIQYANHAAVLANAGTDATNAAAYTLAKWGV